VAGQDLEQAVPDGEDDQFLVEDDAAVLHYQVVEPVPERS
jgi:hypothetical protein